MRTPGTGTIERLPSGRYRPQLPGRGGKKLAAHDTREAAERALDIALHLIRTEGLREVEPGTTLGPYGRRVLLARREHGYRNAGRELSRWATHVEESDLGRRAVEAIRRADVTALVRALSRSKAKRGRGHATHKSRPLSRSVVLDVLRILRAVFREAVDVDVLRDDDPTAGVEVPRAIGRTHEPWTWLRPAEVVRLLEVGRTATTERDLGGLARADGARGRAVVGLVPPDDLRAAIVALYTGLREGELWTLHRTDVDFEAGRLVVRYGGRGRGGLLPTKGRRPRTLTLLAPAVEALRVQLASHPHALVFPSPSPTHPGAYRAPRAPRSFAPWLAAAGLGTADRPDEAPVTWHSLRHTFATLALAGRLPGCEGEGRAPFAPPSSPICGSPVNAKPLETAVS